MGGDGSRLTRADLTLFVAVGVLLLGLVATLGRVAQLQTRPSDRLGVDADRHITLRTAESRRGDLVDRVGRVVAASRPAFRLVVDPTLLEEPFGPTLERIALVTGVGLGEVADRVVGAVAANERRAAARERVVWEKAQCAALGVPWRGEEAPGDIRYVRVGGPLADWQAASAKEMGARGVRLERLLVRERVAGDEVAALVGKVGWDGRGRVGAEAAFDEALASTEGVMRYVRDAMGEPLWMEAEGYRPGRAGESVRMSVDLEIQALAERELRRGVEAADAAGGRIMALDPRTGEVLAMADLIREPADAVDFDSGLADEMARGGERVRFRTVRPDPLRAVEPELARVRCVEDVYEPGSTFKPIVWASLVERGVMAPDDVVDSEGGAWRTPYGRRVEDVVPKDEQTWHDVLVNSSNVGMAKGTGEVGFDALREDILRFGFGRTTSLDLEGESAGLVTGPRAWSKWTQTSVSFGYEVGVTTAQVARAFCVFARGGVLAGTLPRMTLRGVEGPEAWRTYERVLSPSTAASARAAMAEVGRKMVEKFHQFHEGEAPIGVELFGKSGTAKVARPDGRGYLDRQYVSSFVAGAPVEDPRLVVVVVIEDPGPALRARNMHYGSMCAGPVVCRVVRGVMGYWGGPEVVGGEGTEGRRDGGTEGEEGGERVALGE